MKIIAFYPGEYPKGFSPMSYRLHYYMKAIQSKGIQVEIVMPGVGTKSNGIYEGIPYSFVQSTVQTRFNKSHVVEEYADICRLLAKNCDIVFTTIRDNQSIMKISKAVHEAGGKIIIELNENPYSFYASRLDTPISLYIKRKYFFMNSIKQVDGIIVISEALFNLVSIYKSKNTDVLKIPILSGINKKKVETHKKATPYILHAGALSEQKDGVKAMLRAFAVAHKELNGNLKFIFTCKTGFPSLLFWIKKFIRKHNLENYVDFRGMVSFEELEELYKNCSIAIVNKPINAQNRYNFPTKLTELLNREIPVIVSKTGELRNYFVDMENAFVVEANNVDQIAEKIIYIQNHPVETKQIALNGRLLAEKEFYYLNHADKLVAFFKQVKNN